MANLVSVGIDVGTTTSQVVVSDLEVTNTARPGFMPQLDVTESTVRFQSEPIITPLVNPSEVDVQKLREFVLGEYAKAGIKPEDVETGAVIITGETARTDNAAAILAGLSEMAGDFVVSVAGPNLESSIAGRGSGACAYSSEYFTTVVNVDIGGGSANAAVFTAGTHITSAASMVGGRQITTDPATCTITHISPPGVAIIADLGLNLKIGQRPDLGELRKFCDAMSDVVADLVLGIPHHLGKKVELTPPYKLPSQPKAVFISGGIGHLLDTDHGPFTLEHVCRFGDIGPMFAESIRHHPRLSQMNIMIPDQTLRATVMGAASQQVTMSGSTIFLDGPKLPIANVPVIVPEIDDLTSAEAVTKACQDAIERFDGAPQSAAIAPRLPAKLNWNQLQTLAEGLAVHMRKIGSANEPLIVVLEHDHAKVLGQTLRVQGITNPLIVVDQVHLGEGDWVDVGEPLFDQTVVPVSVKTLVFYTKD